MCALVQPLAEQLHVLPAQQEQGAVLLQGDERLADDVGEAYRLLTGQPVSPW